MSWILSAFADEAGLTPDEQIAALKRAELNHVDLRGVGDHNITALPPDEAKSLKSRLDDAGIGVSMFGSPIGKIDIADDFQSDLQKLEHLGQLAEILGCQRVRIFSYYNQAANLSLEQWQNESLERLAKLRERARALGLVLYHENEKHIFGDKCEQVKAIASHVRDGESFRMIFDFDNYNQTDEDVWANWETLREVTDAFHLKDSTAGKMHVPIGQGHGRAREILGDALQRGWSGPLSLEPHLKRSEAVMATGPGGAENQALKEMSPADCFQLAAEQARQLLSEVGATYQ